MTTTIQNIEVRRYFGGLTAFKLASQEEASNALKVRKQWLTMMGMTETEIAEDCALDPPTDLDAELAEYNAMFRIQDRNCRQ
jgi:hypothetical protein